MICRCREPIGAAAGAGQPPHRCARRVAAPAPAAEHSSSGGAPAATTFLLLSGKSAQDQQLLASAAGELSLAEEGGGELAVSLALDASGDAGYDAAAYMGALQAALREVDALVAADGIHARPRDTELRQTSGGRRVRHMHAVQRQRCVKYVCQLVLVFVVPFSVYL
ncbi:uncharacterized protein [Triticum aestivum]|uniref:uncharacterized protein n=1 Tax=Triticum aestivum TaxID=4565 RepID=UPI001D011AA4|nr:uncharacterized protein LOC123170922 [Triticum aestivum]